MRVTYYATPFSCRLYNCTVFSRPRYSASATSACPMLTSCRPGSSCARAGWRRPGRGCTGGRRLRCRVRCANVALVGPRVHRDALGPEALDIAGGLQQVGPRVQAAGIAQGGYFVDVNAQLDHRFQRIFKI
uniref:Uncharacterized protein n=1 Tax=Tanacetum cinerariifolium TaxID=118510 RepID=A0A699TB82_TANCI|nr:hypothetical protein [Tanacetum cinerariifolium]